MATPARDAAAPVESMAAQFHDLLRSMSSDSGVLDMEAVVRYATVAVTGAEHAAITLERAGRKPQTVYATGELPIRVDALQYDLDEGPCVAALTENDLVLVGDLRDDSQFPQFSPEAARLGVRSMLSVRLFLTADDRAALNLYATRPQAFDAGQLPVAAIFASYASLILLNQLREDQITHLERALRSNREIGVAIGILMAQSRSTQDEAFEQLLRASQSLNQKLRRIADDVNRTGRLPDRPVAPHG